MSLLPRRSSRAALTYVVCALVVWFSAPWSSVRAQLLDEARPTGAQNYANTRWVLQRPDQNPTDACVGGFFSFLFSETGYFVYNNRIRGSWRVDQLGNLRLKTHNGPNVLLLANGNTLRPVANAGFVLKRNIFQRCEGR
jgi:hypothetical protein